MFDSIAPAYDFMNRAMTMGIDRLWRHKAVRLLRDCQHDDILDIATGTGDLAIKLARELDPIAVTGVDLSEGMIEIGRAKVAKEGLQEVVTLGIGDCLLLPFTDASFDAVTCAYGVRNFADLPGRLSRDAPCAPSRRTGRHTRALHTDIAYGQTAL